MKLSSIFAAIVFISLLTVASFSQNRKLNVELQTLVAGAADTLDAREMDSLLSDDFTQAEVSDRGSAVLTKARIINQLRNMPEVLKPFVEHVSTRSEVTNLAAIQNGTTAVFTANLIARSTLKVSAKMPGKTLTQVERYEISGSASRVGDRWKLTSIRRTQTVAKDISVRVEEMKGNKAFEAAVFGLMLEGVARARAANSPDFY